MKKKTYYVYRITCKMTGDFYIGYRGTTSSPYKDLGFKYFTSGSLKKRFMELPSNFKTEILYFSSSERKCFRREQNLIMNNYQNEKCHNRHYSARVAKKPLSDLITKPVPKIKAKRIWSDEKMSFVNVGQYEFDKLVAKEKFVNSRRAANKNYLMSV